MIRLRERLAGGRMNGELRRMYVKRALHKHLNPHCVPDLLPPDPRYGSIYVPSEREVNKLMESVADAVLEAIDEADRGGREWMD